ncbi:hypothetical protein SPRG_01522 [Saprolegnia parasitica CBS 223.65]|uniref:Uncharacterized protein n=1 Tax=Saprolegnia parasitica (strain CBS 223.65) TaxID=695850 RepID=A0A067D6R2_SAPPC|nr:hypothetical protein SPRG_01522 [Saprolegnia parasitica CBS 223.65]KDO34386.1 hypothetical protein SPRG_01522 [Saprolegnia parasitica CBS 223.65]|eukprot:XP_012195122.1 hypothetical protein SPRG_01522 [Saprolegnia parasitica CBS 223.65]
MAPCDRATVPVSFHLAALTSATVLGAVVFATKKGTKLHVLLGRATTAAIAATCISSFRVKELRTQKGCLGSVHALSALTLAFLARGMYAISTRKVKVHQQFMAGSMVGLLGVGALTLLKLKTRTHSVP